MIENTTTLTNQDLFIGGVPRVREYQTLLTIDARATVLKYGTVLGKIVASGKWAPWAKAATDGTAMNVGIYVGADLTAAQIDAADVPGLDIVVGGDSVLVNAELLVIEGSDTLDTVIAGTTVYATTLRDLLATRGLFVQESYIVNGGY